MVNNVLFLEIIEGYFFRVFQGLPLFGRLLLFVFDKVPRAMLIWGATTIRQVRVGSMVDKKYAYALKVWPFCRICLALLKTVEMRRYNSTEITIATRR